MRLSLGLVPVAPNILSQARSPTIQFGQCDFDSQTSILPVGVVMLINTKFLPAIRLEVEGLAEKRPSVIITDRIFVRNYGSPSKHWFEGYVHKVEETLIDLRFNGSFNSYQGQKYYVRFDLNRLTYRRMHQALGTAPSRSHILFPSPPNIFNLRPPTEKQQRDIRCVDRKVGENPPQLQAVSAILHRPPGSVPFIVNGPYVHFSTSISHFYSCLFR